MTKTPEKVPSIQVSTHVHVRRTNTMQITGAMLISFLRQAGLKVPYEAAVRFNVPDGGDWSNTSIDVDAENPVEIQWVETQESEQ